MQHNNIGNYKCNTGDLLETLRGLWRGPPPSGKLYRMSLCVMCIIYFDHYKTVNYLEWLLKTKLLSNCLHTLVHTLTQLFKLVEYATESIDKTETILN